MLHTIFYVIVFLLTLVLSNVLNKVFPKLALPLIQVVFGLILGFFGADEILHVAPEFFLGFIIAPLLFRESEEADVKHILKHSKVILVLIFPLVFITALGLGFISHWIYAGIPLAACFALGASLAPTDAVAVGALSKNFSFPKRVMSILKGEGLLNDASGIIAFQIAMVALVTGYFSLPDATMKLVFSAIGGSAIGFVLIYLKNLILRLLEDVDARDVPGYLLLELAIPLSAFLIAEELHVSGIIAAVVAGVMSANGLKRTTLFDAQVAKLKSTIWDTLTFILNSIVFFFLGIELYQLVVPLLMSPVYSSAYLLLLAVVLTIGLFALRFAIIALYYWIQSIRRRQTFIAYWNDILLLTFAGSKGTVSIATILLIPRNVIDSQPVLVFLAAAVTGLSFLVGMFILPFFAIKKVVKVNNISKISILTDVVEELAKDSKKAKNPQGYRIAIDAYQERIQQLIIEQESTDLAIDYNDLQLLIIRLESEGLEVALRENKISMYTYRTYQRYIHSLESSVAHSLVSSIQFIYVVIVRGFHLLLSKLLHIDFGFKKTKDAIETTRTQITELYFSNTELILQALDNLQGVFDDQLLHFLQAERLRTAEIVATGGHISRLVNKAQPTNLTEMMRAYYLERKVIFEYESSGQLTAREAKDMRLNVNVLEDYTLASNQRSLLFDFLERRKK
ncbi:cation:proton antiporter [Lactococcus allomyrinae]|uniref:Sodium:proton antiporter n=1 Tax=Lactococcus allomyrinae TaxID=2419773 RepID=A0A387BD19_9LACT|nr:sodium:proton antiporter [Lactococcus allomyrinae]AYG01795.1 sodium:proton antiporter [Lactococcus allomyrinae]